MNQFKKAAALGVLISLASAGLSFGANIDTNGEIEVRHVNQRINDYLTGSKVDTQYQLRYGISSNVSDKATVKAGFISGTKAARNGYAGNNQNEKSVAYIDYAYVEYATCENSTLTLGKFHNNLFTASQLVWDQDINPNGIGFNYNFSHGFGLNLLYNTLSDQAGDTQVNAIERTTLQLTYDLNLLGHDINSGIAYTISDDTFEYLNVDARLNVGMFFVNDIYATYASLNDSQDSNSSNAALVGITFGADQVKDGDWQLDVNYRELPSDSRLALQTDDQFFAGKSDVRGYSAGFNYGLSDSTQLNLVYNTGNTKGASLGEGKENAYTEYRVGLTAQF